MPGMVAPGHPQYHPAARPTFAQPAPGHGGGPQSTGMPRQNDMQNKRKKLIRLWEDELISQEEKRAAHPRYNTFVQNRISNLQDSIEQRLASFSKP